VGAGAHGTVLAWPDAALAVLGALAAHVSVNALNEYMDFKSGLDMRTQRTPFSGGSGVLPARPELINGTLAMGLITLGWTALTGLYFVWRDMAVLPALVPVGLVGLLSAVAYTPWVTRHPWLCLVARLALLPFGLVNNLLLLNQFPDVDADRPVGRITWPLALNVVKGASRHAQDTPALLPFMGMNVAVNLLTPILTALGLVLSV
jgi:1,4-dihydroxy-2-naphthoate octaprenyltransferase